MKEKVREKSIGRSLCNFNPSYVLSISISSKTAIEKNVKWPCFPQGGETSVTSDSRSL